MMADGCDEREVGEMFSSCCSRVLWRCFGWIQRYFHPLDPKKCVRGVDLSENAVAALLQMVVIGKFTLITLNPGLQHVW